MNIIKQEKSVVNEVFLSLGSNLGNRTEYLRRAIHILGTEAGEIVSSSSVWETAPWGFESDNSFLNMALLLITDLSPAVMLAKIHSIEKDLGRERTGEGYSSRTIDIDILYWNNEIISTEGLNIPHPLIRERMFVLAPLNEIAADFRDPVSGQTVAEMVFNCTDKANLERLATL